MANRMLNGEIARSESLSHVSRDAALTFVLLISVADDYGRFDGRPLALLASLYALRNDVDLSDLEGWLQELETEGLIVRYEAEGRRYLSMPAWPKYQRLRNSRSKWPEPPVRGKSPQVAARGGSSPPETETETETEPGHKLADARHLAADLFEACSEVAEKHGRSWKRLKAQFEKHAPARLRDPAMQDLEPKDVLIGAVQGFVLRHSNGDWREWKDYLRPKTVFSPEKHAEYVEVWLRQKRDRAHEEEERRIAQEREHIYKQPMPEGFMEEI